MIDNILIYSFIAGILSVDITAFGQFMISRPIVCGPLFGYLLGDIRTGLWIGIIVEMLWMNVIPMGAAIPQDTMSVAVLATVWSVASFPGERAAAIYALLLAVPFGLLFRWFDIKLRFFNVAIVHWTEKGVAAGREGRIPVAVYLGILLFFLKAFVFYALLMYPGIWFLERTYPLLPGKIIAGLDLAWQTLPLAGLGLLLFNFRDGKFPCNRLGGGL